MSNKYLIVIVEDEYNISSFVSAVLQANGFDTMVARNGAEAIILITSHCPDLVLLDLGLPDMDGQGIIENVRGWSNVPIIVVSARTRERDKVMALESGADDYITKPFAIEELLARIRVILRKGSGKREEEGNVLSACGVLMNVASHTVTCEGKEIALTNKEFSLLQTLLENKNIVLSRDTLLTRVWSYDYIGETNVVDVYVRYLRQKIDDAFGIRLIQTVRGVGYVIKDETA